MLRHRLASFFDPKSLIVISDIDLPILTAVPASLGPKTTALRISPEQNFEQLVVEHPLDADCRRELAVVCVEHSRMEKVLNYLEAAPPKAFPT